MWRVIWPSIVIVSVGCHAPMPSINDITPTSASRVPPPSTGAVGAAPQNQYYPGANQPTGAIPTVSVGLAPTSAIAAPNGGAGAVQPAMVAPGTAVPTAPNVIDTSQFGAVPQGNLTANDLIGQPASGGAQVRVVAPAAGSAGASVGVAAGGAPQEPMAFQPQGQVVEISQLPAAPVGTGVPVTQPPATPNAAALNWQQQP